MKKEKNKTTEQKLESDIDKIQTGKNADIQELEQKIGELTLGWQRCQADFTNYRRQVEEDRKKLVKLANADLMMEILPVLDNFQLAAKHIPAELVDNNWAQGIRQIEKQLEDILANEGLKKIETIGHEFDPYKHEAVEHIESDKKEGEVVEEVSAGYEFDGQVLRPARVRVAKSS